MIGFSAWRRALKARPRAHAYRAAIAAAGVCAGALVYLL
jgi:hypothetical protein